MPEFQVSYEIARYLSRRTRWVPHPMHEFCARSLATGLQCFQRQRFPFARDETRTFKIRRDVSVVSIPS